MINERSSDSSQEQLLISLKVDIGNNRTEILRIYQSEDIQDKIPMEPNELYIKKENK